MKNLALKICAIGIGLAATSTGFAWTWHDLWLTKDRQAHQLFHQGQFQQAQAKFLREDWRATAAYRAGDYKTAAALFQSLDTTEGYYNQGNALAHLKEYTKALQTYDKVLAQNPKHQDAKHNREIVKQLLRQQQQAKKSASQNSDQSKANQSKQANSSPQSLGQNSAQTEGKKKNAQEQSDAKAHAPQAKETASSSAPSPSATQKQPPTQPNKTAGASKAPTAEQREQQRLKRQWLRLIPDDPGGFLREKFRRDYLRQQHEWSP